MIASANSTSTLRSGTVTIAGLPFAVSQAGTPCAIVKFLPTSQSIPAAGGDYEFTATVTPSDCAWTTNTTAPAWVTLKTSGGTGESVVSYTVAENTTTKPRNGTINVVLTQTPTKKKVFTVKQAK
jgi:hypothetical protein